ncbi:MAG: hypothetical protein IT223_09040 [Crocinitomicaceae bacterium]|nr:hypothetical protein [Crocinitomicaceae bacterium]
MRFIEEMSFNGKGDSRAIKWNWKALFAKLEAHYPSLEKIESSPHSASMNFSIPGHIGTIGIIAAYSRAFCGTCDRMRVTAKWSLKTCLYYSGVLNIRDLLLSYAEDDFIASKLIECVGKRALNGFEAEKIPVSESMAGIGG